MTYPDPDKQIRWWKIDAVDTWLDDNVSAQYQNQPLAQDWARVSKVAEELGEAISELIGSTGQNPRKGVNSTREKVLNELADVVVTGMAAIQHFTKDSDRSARIVADKVDYVYQRMNALMNESELMAGTPKTPDKKDPEGVSSMSRKEYQDRQDTIARDLIGEAPKKTDDPEGTEKS